MPQIIPIAVTAGDLTGSVGSVANMDGSGSYDPGGADIVTYEWSILYKPPGSSATLKFAATPTPQLTPDVVGTYRLFLKVYTQDGRASDSNLRTAPSTAYTHVRVATARQGWDIPAAGETGWGNRLYLILSDVDGFVDAGDDISRLGMSGAAGEVITPDGSGGTSKRRLEGDEIDVPSGTSLTYAPSAGTVDAALVGLDSSLGTLDNDVDSLETRVASLEGSASSATTSTVVVAYSGTVAVGDAVYINSSGACVRAQANSVATTFPVGFITAVNGSNATVAIAGLATGHSGLTPGQRYFLSSTTAGGISSSAPTAAGQYVTQIGIALSATSIILQVHPPVLLS